MMRADAGFHADQARRHIGKPRFDLAARPLLPQHDRARGIDTKGRALLSFFQGLGIGRSS
jgi:hypothetical protein